ncbi:MAG: hypothetical protein GY845_15680, partial [Planctomycetes bacterium]|nr:hypothetical protein [Planctomycetota bacterium]
MILFLQNKKATISLKSIAIFIVFAFGLSTFTVYITKNQPAYASALPYMPPPTKLIGTSADFLPATIKGIKFYKEDPFRFDFIIDEGNTKYSDQQLKEESQRLIEYFLTSLTTPKEDLWVNLSPHESDRVIPKQLGLTDMGRDMLGEDYVLKQLASSLTYPESQIGKEFWAKVHQKAYQKYGTTNIPTDTYNKVWVIPQKAVVYEEADGAFLGERSLKVMMEADYFAAQKNQQTRDQRPPPKAGQAPTKDLIQNSKFKIQNSISSQIAKEIILPMIEDEINNGAQFAHLRQIYDALILATWFKKRLRQTIDNRPKTIDRSPVGNGPARSSVLDQIYFDKNKIKGVEGNDPQIKEKIYNQYVEAYKKGVYNYIKKDYDSSSGKRVNRRYYSGGEKLDTVGDVTTVEPGKGVSADGPNDETTIEAEFEPQTLQGLIEKKHGKKQKGTPVAPRPGAFDEIVNKRDLGYKAQLERDPDYKRRLEEKLPYSQAWIDGKVNVLMAYIKEARIGWSFRNGRKNTVKYLGIDRRVSSIVNEFSEGKRKGELSTEPFIVPGGDASTRIEEHISVGAIVAGSILTLTVNSQVIDYKRIDGKWVQNQTDEVQSYVFEVNVGRASRQMPGVGGSLLGLMDSATKIESLRQRLATEGLTANEIQGMYQSRWTAPDDYPEDDKDGRINIKTERPFSVRTIESELEAGLRAGLFVDIDGNWQPGQSVRGVRVRFNPLVASLAQSSDAFSSFAKRLNVIEVAGSFPGRAGNNPLGWRTIPDAVAGDVQSQVEVATGEKLEEFSFELGKVSIVDEFMRMINNRQVGRVSEDDSVNSEKEKEIKGEIQKIVDALESGASMASSDGFMCYENFLDNETSEKVWAETIEITGSIEGSLIKIKIESTIETFRGFQEYSVRYLPEGAPVSYPFELDTTKVT